MANSKFIRGAIVEFNDAFLLPVPNIIIFQFNPETITHTLNQPETAQSVGTSSNPLAVKNVPGESFSFTLAMDAEDMISEGSPVAQGIALTTGIYTRLAALEMLLYPAAPSGKGGLVGSVSAAASGSVSAGGISLGGSASANAQVKRPVPQSQVPLILFVWGPGRILPVRITSLTINEKLYDPLLNPTHAEAQISLRVLTSPELTALPSGALTKVAQAAYDYSQGLRQGLAIANLANAAESIIGMLPL